MIWALWELAKTPLAWLLRCRSCGALGLPESHYPTCPRLWRNGGEITGSGDAWHKEHGWTREESARGWRDDAR